MKRFALLIIVIAGIVLILRSGTGIASASERETELFNKGYEYLFSYKPDKAAETFRIFLKEFPESSARDAALFWLGKTLISMKLYGEAELTFQTIQKEFPDSPFIVFIDIEMEEIARVRSEGSSRDVSKTADAQKDAPSMQAKDDKRPAEPDKKLTQLAAEKEKIEAMLTEERKANHERQLRIANLESRETLLRKQIVDLESQVARLSNLEIHLKEARDEKDRLSVQIAQLKAEKSRREKDSVPGDQVSGQEKISDDESGGSIKLRLSQLEVLAENQGKELAHARDEQAHLKKLIAEEKKFAAELSTDLTRAKEREQEFKTLVAKADEQLKSAGKKSEGETASVKELGKLTAELDQFRSQVSDLQIEKKHLTDRVESMEWQAEQRIRDMRILNAYLTRLMFQKKETPQQKPDMKAAEERDKYKAALEEERKNISDLRGQLAGIKEQQARPQTLQDTPSAPLLAPGAVVRIRNRDYPLKQIIDHQISASQVFKRFGIKDIAWRTGNALDDFLSEELLLMEAKKTNITIDTKKQKELVESHKLSAAEADYLEKFMIIARYIDTQYTGNPTQKWIELISVVYKPGDAAAKTVLATDLQKAAREGKPFEEIGKMHPERVNFSRLSIQEFSAKYKDKSQLLQKLNFLKEETVVVWSDKGYMLIKPVSGRVPFNPFIEMKADENDKIRSFVRKYIDELKTRN